MSDFQPAAELPDLLPRLRAVVARIAGRAGAEDALQESCVRILQKEHLYRGEPSGFAAWATTVARHRSFSLFRKPRREEEMGDLEATAPESSIDEERIAWIFEQLRRLPEADRELLQMRYFEGLTVHEVGERLGLSQAGASKRLAAAVERLQARARRQGFLSLALPTSWAAYLASVHKMKLTLAAASALAATTAASTFFLPDPETPIQGNSAQFARTTFAPSLTSPFDPQRNVLWCGTMSLAWDALVEASGDEFDRAGLEGPARVIDADPFDGSMIDPLSYVAVAGFDSKQVVEEAQRQLQAKFGQGRDPVLDQLSGTVAYSFLAKSMKFKTNFDDLVEWPFVFGTPSTEPGAPLSLDVAAFGVEDYKGPTFDPGLAEQAEILRYESPEDFVVRLLPQGKDRIYVARFSPEAKPAESLQAMWQSVAGTAAAYAKLSGDERRSLAWNMHDSLAVPKLDFDLSHTHPGFSFPHRGSVLPLTALQWLRVELNESGAEVRSRVSILSGASANGPKRMVCDGPFLVAFIEEGAEWPYCMAWIADAELLVPREAEESK